MVILQTASRTFKCVKKTKNAIRIVEDSPKEENLFHPSVPMYLWDAGLPEDVDPSKVNEVRITVEFLS